jgi:hypothetical protein
MADRYQSDDRSRRDRSQRGYGRQAEQFQSDHDDERRGQMGDSWRDDEHGAQQSGWQSDERYDRGRSSGAGDYGAASSGRFGTAGYGPARYTPGGGRSFSSFTGNDFGGGDFSGGTGSQGRGGAWGAGAGSWLGANHGEWRDRDFGGGHSYARDRTYGRGEDRGFFERAGDEVASWFGDEDATRRREQDHRGRGPAGYVRTDERIREDASERLTDDRRVDARKIEVAVSKGEITLTGTVTSRDQKRRAEDLVEDLSGVKHVQNNLRVDEGSTWDRNNSGTDTGKTTS